MRALKPILAGEWVLFDATGLAPLNGIVKISTGRDAADAAIANSVWQCSLYIDDSGLRVGRRTKRLNHFFYNNDDTIGICYL